MFLGVVKGEITATVKHVAYEHSRMLVVERLDERMQESGGYLIAVSATDAGVGQRVLVLDEGNGARQVLRDSAAPIRSVVVGVVDAVDVDSP